MPGLLDEIALKRTKQQWGEEETWEGCTVSGREPRERVPEEVTFE